MQFSSKTRSFAMLFSASALVLAGSSTVMAQMPPPKTNHFLTMPVNHNGHMQGQMPYGSYAPNAPQHRQMMPPPPMPMTGNIKRTPKKWNPRNRNMAGPQAAPAMQYRQPHHNTGPKSRYKPTEQVNLWDKMRGRKPLSQQIRTQQPTPAFQQWVEYEPEYTLYPGDQLDIVVASAPELSRTLTVGPDGRIVMPMSKPVMAAGKGFTQVQKELSAELATQLRDPTVAVTPRAYAPEQIYVGGEVGQPGTYTLPGRVGALEALLMAGGMRETARTKQVAILRRAPNGGMMMRTVNIRNGLLNIREYNDNIQLRRGDIVFVPQNTLAEIGTFMQNFRNALPVDLSVSYNLGDSFRAN